MNGFYFLKSRKISWNHPSEKWTLPRVTQSLFTTKIDSESFKFILNWLRNIWKQLYNNYRKSFIRQHYLLFWQCFQFHIVNITKSSSSCVQLRNKLHIQFHYISNTMVYWWWWNDAKIKLHIANFQMYITLFSCKYCCTRCFISHQILCWSHQLLMTWIIHCYVLFAL